MGGVGSGTGCDGQGNLTDAIGGGGGPGAPMVVNHGPHCKKSGMPPSPTFQQLMAARRLLCRRYYPEGGWGWIVIIVGVLVNTMTHGIQLSYGALLAYVMRSFGNPYTDTDTRNDVLLHPPDMSTTE